MLNFELCDGCVTEMNMEQFLVMKDCFCLIKDLLCLFALLFSFFYLKGIGSNLFYKEKLQTLCKLK